MEALELFCLGWPWKHNSPNLYLPNTWVYRCEPPHPPASKHINLGCRGCLCFNLVWFVLEANSKSSKRADPTWVPTTHEQDALPNMSSRRDLWKLGSLTTSMKAYLAGQRWVAVQLAVLRNVYSVSEGKESVKSNNEVRVLVEELWDTSDDSRSVDARERRTQVGKRVLGSKVRVNY
jgi:hypothetical protein